MFFFQKRKLQNRVCEASKSNFVRIQQKRRFQCKVGFLFNLFNFFSFVCGSVCVLPCKIIRHVDIQLSAHVFYLKCPVILNMACNTQQKLQQKLGNIHFFSSLNSHTCAVASYWKIYLIRCSGKLQAHTNTSKFWVCRGIDQWLDQICDWMDGYLINLNGPTGKGKGQWFAITNL